MKQFLLSIIFVEVSLLTLVAAEETLIASRSDNDTEPLSCPPGYDVATWGSPQRSKCYHILTEVIGITCNIYIVKGSDSGYLIWTAYLWLNITDDEIIYDKYCPYI